MAGGGGAIRGAETALHLVAAGLCRLVSGRVADLAEGALDELLALIPKAMIDGSHRLDHTGRGAGKSELAVLHLAFIQGEGTVAEHDKPAVGEIAGFIFVEIEDDFFIGERVIADFHRIEQVGWFLNSE